jgi:hypothetical protein
MALFRKFFLKKTPDRLLEISERVYGIMPSSHGRAGPAGCSICGGVSHSGEDFFLLGRGLDEFCSSAALWDLNCAAVCSALQSTSVVLCN